MASRMSSGREETPRAPLAERKEDEFGLSGLHSLLEDLKDAAFLPNPSLHEALPLQAVEDFDHNQPFLSPETGSFVSIQRSEPFRRGVWSRGRRGRVGFPCSMSRGGAGGDLGGRVVCFVGTGTGELLAENCSGSGSGPGSLKVLRHLEMLPPVAAQPTLRQNLAAAGHKKAAFEILLKGE